MVDRGLVRSYLGWEVSFHQDRSDDLISHEHDSPEKINGVATPHGKYTR